MGLSKQTRIITLLVIDTAFFLLEIIAGYSVHSLALVADSFHMLNDVMSLVVALYALRLVNSRTSPKRLSYGYIRAEILGALINGVFLLALCFTILISAMERFFEPQEITNPDMVLIVGSAGLASNIIGLLLFHEHNHSHGHSHDHGPKKSTDTKPASPPIDIFVHPARSRQSIVEAARPDRRQSIIEGMADAAALVGSPDSSSSSSSAAENNDITELGAAENRNGKMHGHKSLNMQGVFLHVLGDFLGNIGVIATALFIKYTTYSWRFYMDPAIRQVERELFGYHNHYILFRIAIRSTCLILLQSVPNGLQIENVHDDIASMSEVISVHELHIWQLSEHKLVASLHVLLMPGADYMSIATRIRQTMHTYGIHSTTIQPEFVKVSPDGKSIFIKSLNTGNEQLVDNEVETHESACLLLCSEDETCASSLCCPPPDNPTNP
ncbi:4910_t:CDS:10 [Paraglomus occultum]|uniref:4910_t:CDS:1 n=1 Tax=Paraglomus occultum TaxID=144539 RepID=A0A9N9GMY7_9GLOM|nr:4910_t:CDS:10 [Paraglomus occultum]